MGDSRDELHRNRFFPRQPGYFVDLKFNMKLKHWLKSHQIVYTLIFKTN